MNLYDRELLFKQVIEDLRKLSEYQQRIIAGAIHNAAVRQDDPDPRDKVIPFRRIQS